TNIRYLESLPERPALAVIDVSFISLDKVLPAVWRLLGPDGRVVALIKPQFEAGRGLVGKGGVVRDPATHRLVLERAVAYADAGGWMLGGLVASPILGRTGNREFLALWGKTPLPLPVNPQAAIDAVMAE
ncbi:MAG: TlyA family rRNA (cytidine-2'-O)-methyltransferase, partial [Chloroflexi bacterium]|nr:TlyA family rRNA (cytidine-2'-O)-methyltransferase [Chloroflexota bacterium]